MLVIIIRLGMMLILSDSEKKEAWKYHYESLLNVENAWEKESLPNVETTKRSAIRVDSCIVVRAIKDISGVAALK